MKFYDHHVHTSLCNHASGTMIEYVKSAICVGMDGIGFSDHSPLSAEYENRFRMSEQEMDIYVNSIFLLRERFKDRIQIKLGIELDYVEEAEEYLALIIEKFPFDFVIGSVHYLRDENGKYSYLSELNGADRRLNFMSYFDKIKKAADSGLFDIVAHFDLPKKFWRGMGDDEYQLAADALENISRNNLAIEINTSGLRTQGIDETFPNKKIIELAKNLGIPFVLGSDSHDPSQVGSYFEETIRLLKEMGIDRTCTFSRRRKVEILI